MRDMKTPTRSCVLCDAPCRHVLCDACYAKTPHAEPEQESRIAARGETFGLPVSAGGVHRF